MPGLVTSINAKNIINQPFEYKGVYQIDNDILGKQISDIEESLKDGSWMNRDFSSLDEVMMPDLVRMANEKKTGLNLIYLNSPAELSYEVQKFIINGSVAQRFIVNMGEGGIHFSVLDFKLIDNYVSVLLFEPATLNGTGPALLAIRIKSAIEKSDFSNVKFSVIEMDIQRSDSECGIFSLALAKKLYKLSEDMIPLHKLNIKNELDDVVSCQKIDHLLPPALFKHTQGRSRMNQYVSANPGIENLAVNKKGQNIIKRQHDNSEEINGKPLSKSIHNKRLTEYKSLIDWVNLNKQQ